MVATIQDMPVAQLYLVEPIADTGVGGQVTFYWNEGDNGAFKAVDNVEANDTLITEGFLALSALKGTTGMEYVYVTGGTSNYLSDGVRQVTYTLTARGLPPTNKSNPPSAGFARFYKSHLADALCVFSETTLTRSLAESFSAATTTQSVVAGEDIDATSAALGVSLHTDGKYYKYDSGTYPNLQGVIQKGESVLTDGSFSLVNLKGTSINHTGLTPNTDYYVTDGGGLTTTSTVGNVFLGRARTASIIDHALQFNASPMSNSEVITGTDTTPKLVTAAQINLGAEVHGAVGISGEALEDFSNSFVMNYGFPNFAGITQETIVGQSVATEKMAMVLFGNGTGFTTLKIALRKQGSPTDNFIVRIETDNAGEPSGTLVDANATALVAGTALTASLVDTTFTMGGAITLIDGTKYWLVFDKSGANDGSNYYRVGGNARGQMKAFSSSVWVASNFPSIYLVCDGVKTSGLFKNFINFSGVTSSTFYSTALLLYCASATKGNTAKGSTINTVTGSGLSPNSAYYVNGQVLTLGVDYLDPNHVRAVSSTTGIFTSYPHIG